MSFRDSQNSPFSQSTVCCLADIPVLFRHTYSRLTSLCRPFLTDKNPEITIDIGQEDIELERTLSKVPDASDAELEETAAYRRFCQAASDRHIVMLHSCAVEADGKAYLFVAESGTGKTTHAGLWLKWLGNRARILNGDKPLLRIGNTGCVTAYGTPWNGKEGWGVAASAPVGGICFLSRGTQNRIETVSPTDGWTQLLSAVYRPAREDQFSAVLDSVTALSQTVPLYALACTISEDAARLAVETMSH